jgi:hypothetical protein
MSNVVSINERNRRIPFESFPPRVRDEVLLEGIKFLGGVTTTLWVPTLLFCYVVDQAALPGYLMASSQALGVFLGFLLHKNPPNSILSCVPVSSHSPNVPKLKRAA